MPHVTDETARQRVLDSYRIVDSLPEAAYDDIVRLAATICDVPIALVTLLDRDRQWFKSKIGMEAAGTPRDIAFCDHAIREPAKLFEVEDATRDDRFRANPLVTGDENIRFYAGMPLVTPEGAAIGTVCVIDHAPRGLDARQRDALAALARLTMNLLDARHREHAHAVDDALSKAEAAEPAPPADAPARAERVVALFELQDFAAAVARLGERGVERALQQLEESLDARLVHGLGDSLTRVTGSGELIVVLHGPTAARAYEGLRSEADALAGASGLRVLSASAESDDPGVSLQDLFLRADAALSAGKDARRDPAAA
jgi:GAF domain-containing protein